MTEFETATLALQQAGLSVAYWQTGLSALTLAVSSGLVLYGFRLMRHGTDQRREEARQYHEEAMQTHEETMLALRTLIERTAPRAD